MATSLTLQNDPISPQGYLKVNGITAATLTETGIATPQATIGSIDGILKATNGLVSDSGGFIFVPLNDPTDPSNNNSNAAGLNVITFAATGNTTATPYTGATQTANLASIVPDNAYMVLIRLLTNNNTNESNNLVSDINVYIRKNSSDSWRVGINAETPSTTIEANAVDTFPLIFDRATKTFQAYLHHTKQTGVTFSSAPSYYMSFDVLGYYIK
jgi:hypothetical protein